MNGRHPNECSILIGRDWLFFEGKALKPKRPMHVDKVKAYEFFECRLSFYAGG